MKTCVVHPKNKRLKQIFKKHGDVWRVLEEWESVPCLNGEPGVLIETNGGAHLRWVKPEDIRII